VHVLPVPRDLPVERGQVTLSRSPVKPAWLVGIRAVTLDFGNTLVRVDRDGLRSVVAETAERVCEQTGLHDRAAFLAAWAEERERQFRDEVPRFREVDLAQRTARVLARLRGLAVPTADDAWDDDVVATRSTPEEVAFAVEVYSQAFVASLPPAPAAGALLERLRSRGLKLAVLSNWPLALTIDRYVEAAGWAPHFDAVVVSQRVGVIKPHPAIFGVAAEALGDPPPETILHVGDDWTADVVGARGVGWRTGFLRRRPADSPLPSSERPADGEADVELDDIADLDRHLG
jgi:HAD superfamily hydrolase (TIGR01509 family)